MISFHSCLRTAVLALAASVASWGTLPSPAAAQDKSAVCEGLWKIARSAARARDRGDSEDKVLDAVQGGIDESTTITPRMAHMMRTTVKGAFIHTNLSPSGYAAKVQVACMNS